MILVSALIVNPLALSIFCLSAYGWECPDGDNGCEEDCGGTGCEEPSEAPKPDADAVEEVHRLFAGYDAERNQSHA